MTTAFSQETVSKSEEDTVQGSTKVISSDSSATTSSSDSNGANPDSSPDMQLEPETPMPDAAPTAGHNLALGSPASNDHHTAAGQVEKPVDAVKVGC